MSIGYQDDDYGPEFDLPFDDDWYWINQNEANDYRYENEARGDIPYDEWMDNSPDFEPDEHPNDFGDYGPGVDDFDSDNTWGVD